MTDFRRNVGDHPTSDSFGLGVMPLLFQWMTPELQRERARYLVDLGGETRKRSGSAGYWDIP